MQTLQAAALASIFAAVPAQASTWELDASHSEVGFKVRHMMVSWTKGRFEGVTGKLELNEKELGASRISVSIDSKSVNTSLKDRDDHLRSADFFDVEKHPEITFRSKSVEVRDGRLKLTGDLTVRGVTRTVVLDADPLSKPMKDPWGGTRIGTRATTTIKRKDFGLTWNKGLELGGVLVGEEVEIALEVEFTRKA